MKLTSEAGAILGRASIGMLALRSGRLPLVNPAVYSYAQGSLWMTTSRYAAKTIIARRDPRAAFLVDGGARAVLLRGALEVSDPLNVSNDVRALLDGPAYFLGLAGYALRNAPFFAGYALDLMRLPREWMPYNRVILRLRVSDADLVEGAPFPPAQAARVPSVPAEVSRRLAGVARGRAGSRVACLSSDRRSGRWREVRSPSRRQAGSRVRARPARWLWNRTIASGPR